MNRVVSTNAANPAVCTDFPAAEPEGSGHFTNPVRDFLAGNLDPVPKLLFHFPNPVGEVREAERAARPPQLVEEEASEFLVVDLPGRADLPDFLPESLAEALEHGYARGIRPGDHRVELVPVDEWSARSRSIHGKSLRLSCAAFKPIITRLRDPSVPIAQFINPANKKIQFFFTDRSS